MKKLLFVCDENRNRSPTAEGLFKDRKGYLAKSCGILDTVEKKINKRLVLWADIIFVMESFEEIYIRETFKTHTKIINLDVYDYYSKDDPELIKLLKKKLKRYLGNF